MKMKQKNKKEEFLGMLLAVFFGNSLAGKEAHALDGVILANERTIMVERNF